MTVESRKMYPYQPLLVADNGKPFAFLVDGYSAFIHCAIAYDTLYAAVFETEVGSSVPVVNLRTKTAQIRVHGRNLFYIPPYFASQSCARITEFTPVLHTPPTDERELFIERIEIFVHHHYS